MHPFLKVAYDHGCAVAYEEFNKSAGYLPAMALGGLGGGALGAALAGEGNRGKGFMGGAILGGLAGAGGRAMFKGRGTGPSSGTDDALDFLGINSSADDAIHISPYESTISEIPTTFDVPAYPGEWAQKAQ